MLMKAITVDAQAVQRHRATILECVKVLHGRVYLLEDKQSTAPSFLRGDLGVLYFFCHFFGQVEFCFWREFDLSLRFCGLGSVTYRNMGIQAFG